MAADILESGDKFGKYIVERLLGTGGMGAVYLVRHQVLGSTFALKVLDAVAAGKGGEIVDRFRREAKIASNTHHPNLAQVYDAGFDETHHLHYLVMEYLPGGNLRDRMSGRGRLSPQEAVRIVRQIAAVLVTMAQRNIVHRDIKPDNIMFAADGSAKLTDLGIAKGNGEQDTLVTMASAVFGTPAYMSPEQARDASSVDCRADIWSLGVVLYEMLAGKRPYDGRGLSEMVSQLMSPDPFPDIRAAVPDIPDALATLIGEMCAKDREKRLATPRELCERLAAIDLTPAQPAGGGGAGETQLTMATVNTLGTVAAPTMATQPSIYVEPEPDKDLESFEREVDKKIRRRQNRHRWLRLATWMLGGLVLLLFGWLLVDRVRHNTPSDDSNPVAVADKPAPVQESPRVAPPAPVPVPQSVTNTSAPAPQPVTNTPAPAPQPVTNTPAPAPAPQPVTNTPAPAPAPQPVTNTPPPPPPVVETVALVGMKNEEGFLQSLVASGESGRFFRISGNQEKAAGHIRAVSASRPDRICLSLTVYAASREMSLPSFEMFLRRVGKELASSGIPFALVSDATDYGVVVRNVAKEESWDIANNNVADAANR